MADLPDALRPFAFASLPVQVRYGHDVIATLGEVVAEVGGRRALLVTNRSVATRTDLIERVRRALGPRFAGCLDHVAAHVPEADVYEGLALLRQSAADVLVSLGGGSPENAAEAIALLHAEGGQLVDHQVVFEPPSGVRVPELHKPKLPIVAVPTTLSGAEIATGFSVTAEQPRRKLLFRDPLTRPRIVLLDPTAAVHTPADFFGATGLNALDHCVEGSYSTAGTPVSDALFRHAARELLAWLPRLAAEPQDVETRGRLLVGGFLAAFGHLHCRPALNHAIAHHLGGTLGMPHGLAHGIPLPHTMRFNADVAAPRLALLADACGLAQAGAEPSLATERLIAAVERLFDPLRLPRLLRDVGVAAADLPGVAEETLRDYALAYNPKPASVTDVLAILRAAW